MAMQHLVDGGVSGARTYPQATVYLHIFDCSIEYSVNGEANRRKESVAKSMSRKTVTIENVDVITFYGLKKMENGSAEPNTKGGFVSIDNYQSAQIVSNDYTYWTRQLGIASYLDTATADDAVRISVMSSNPYPSVNIAIYPQDDIVFWVRLDKCYSTHIQCYSPYDGKLTFDQEVTQRSTFNYAPVFTSASNAYNTAPQAEESYTYIANTNLMSGMEYSRCIHSESISQPYPVTTESGVSSSTKYNLPVSTLDVVGAERLVPPVWILVFGSKDKDSDYSYSPSDYTTESSENNKGTFDSRTTPPTDNNPYYIRKGYTYQGVKGLNPSCQGNDKWQAKYGLTEASVLPNCVGYAVGRFNEIIGENACNYICWSGGSPNACDFIKYFGTDGQPQAPKVKISHTPQLGAAIVWGEKKLGDCGHIGIVEEILDNGARIKITHSGWGEKSDPGGKWRTPVTLSKSNGWSWNGYPCIGFLLNPATRFSTLYDSEASELDNWEAPVPSTFDYDSWIAKRQSEDVGYEQVSVSDIKVNVETELIGTTNDIHGLNLLSTPTLVESPFISVKIGDYTFGSYTKKYTLENAEAAQKVTYPNYMQSLKITKTNGAVNQYVLTMQYQIQAGEDPNLIDKIFSSVSDTRKISLSYGDWNAPSFIYRNEDAIITKVNSNVDFAHSCITYTVYCTSTALSLKSKVYDFPSRTSKPSDIIRYYIRNNSYGLTDLFYGMKTDVDKALSLIASDDKVVDIKPQQHIDILTYLNFLVANMISSSNKDTNIQNSMYSLVLRDETSGELEGPYFKVVKVDATSKALTSAEVYEVDVGFPGETLVMDFKLKNDNSWAILYNYSDKINRDEYVYKIGDDGKMYTEYSPNITTSDKYKQTTSVNKTWWTLMTKFPITATLTIKGLIRPAMLMENVKINAYFYGQRHISSGLYVITKQEDTVDARGYKTELTLLRIAGDDDEIYSIKQVEVFNSDGSADKSKIGGGTSMGGKLGSGRNHNGSAQ